MATTFNELVTRNDLAALELALGRRITQLEDLLHKVLTQQKLSKENGVQPEFFSPREFAEMTALSRSTVQSRIMDGSLKAIQMGGRRGRWQIPRTELLRYLEEADKYLD